jgi:hypothetical protein
MLHYVKPALPGSRQAEAVGARCKGPATVLKVNDFLNNSLSLVVIGTSCNQKLLKWEVFLFPKIY